MIQFTFFQLLLLIGLGNSIILLISFTRIKKSYRKPALFLGLFIVGMLSYQANFVVIPEVQRNTTILIPNLPVLLFLPALLLFFVKSSIDTNFSIRGTYLYFLFPGLIDVLYRIGAWLYVTNHSEGAVYDFITGRGAHFLYEGIGIVFSLLCLILIIKLLLKQNFKNTDGYRFFRFVILGVFLILLRWMVMYWVDFSAPGSYDTTLQDIFWLLDSLFLLYMGYKFFTVPKIIRLPAKQFTNLEGKTNLQDYLNRLNQLLNEEKIFLNPELKRSDLAEKLELSEVQISSLFKQGYQSSFYEVINEYRIKEAIKLIDSGRLEKITIEALAKESGFKSKTTFNKTFKKHNGTTPSFYLQSNSYT